MRINRLLLLVILFSVCLSVTGAETITLSIVQNEEAPAIAVHMSQTIEDEVLRNYYDYGHILSNESIRFDGVQFSQKNFQIKEAAFGYSDYLLVVYLHYGPVELRDEDKKTSYAVLDTLTWRLVKVDSSAILAEKTIDVTKIPVTDFDPYQQSRVVADRISMESVIEIQKEKRGEKNK